MRRRKKELDQKVREEKLEQVFDIEQKVIDSRFNYFITKDKRYITFMKLKMKITMEHLTDDEKLLYVKKYYQMFSNISKQANIINLNRDINFYEKKKHFNKNIKNLNIKKQKVEEYLFNIMDINSYQLLIECGGCKEDKYKVLEEVYHQKEIDESIYKEVIKYYGMLNIIFSQEEEIKILEENEKNDLYERFSVIKLEENSIEDLIDQVENIYSIEDDMLDIVPTSDLDTDYLLKKLVHENLNIKEYSDYYYDDVKKEYARILTITDFSMNQRIFYLQNILNNDEIEFNMLIKKMSRDNSLSLLESSINELNTRYKFDSRHSGQSEAKKDYQAITSLYEDIDNSLINTVCNVEIKLKIRAKSKKALNKKTKKLTNQYKTKVKISNGISEVREDIFKFSSFKKVKLNMVKQLGMEELAYSFPFNYSIFTDEKGTIKNLDNNEVLLVDFFKKAKDRESYNGLVVGNTGSGKSVTLKSMIKEHVGNGQRCFVIDQDSEYEKLVTYLGGENLNFGGINNNYINILQPFITDTSENYITNHLNIVVTFLENIFELSQSVKMIIKKSLLSVYDEFDITDVNLKQIEDTKAFPVFEDLVNKIKKEHELSTDKREKENLKETLNILIDLIATYPIFNHHTNIDISQSNLINFVVTSAKTDDKLLNSLLFIIFNFLNLEMSKNKLYLQNHNNQKDKIKYLKDFVNRQKINIAFDELDNEKDYGKRNGILDKLKDKINIKRNKIMIIFDEAHRMFEKESVVTYIIKTVREARKYLTGIWFATQSLKDFFNVASKQIQTLYDLLVYKILLKQTPSAMQFVAKNIDLTSSQINLIINATAGNGIIILGKMKYNYSLPVSKKWIELFDGGL